MKIAIDTLFLGQKFQHTGTAVYLKNVLNECLRICETNPQDMEFHGFASPNDGWNRGDLASRFLQVHKAAILRKRSFWLLGGMALRTMRVHPDLVFLPTAHHSLPGPWVPVVTTILDAMPKRLSPDLIGRGFPPLHAMTWINARLASRVMTISSWSKQDLIEIYNLNPEKVDVVHLGFDKGLYNDIPPAFDSGLGSYSGAAQGVRRATCSGWTDGFRARGDFESSRSIAQSRPDYFDRSTI